MIKPIFYYYPFSCSTAAHIVLEESGLEYQRSLIDLRGSQHRNTDYMQLNPKGAVPALLIQSGLLTENQAILTYLADSVPAKKLLQPQGSEQRARTHEWMNYCAASLHNYVRMVFRPSAYAGDSLSAQKCVRARGLELVDTACGLIEDKLVFEQWSVGSDFCISDAYLFIMYLWTRDRRMGDMPHCPKWKDLARCVALRESTQTVLEIELENRQDYIMPDL